MTDSMSQASVRKSIGGAGWTAVAVLVAVIALKSWLALRLPLFGDEAFYRLESTRLAWGYSDVPLATPWLIRLGTAVAGEGPLGVRWPFLLLGVVLVLLCGRWTLAVSPPTLAADAGRSRTALLFLALPLAATLGLFALPDVPMTIAMLAAALSAARALAEPSRANFALLGAALALGWLCHYRFVIVYVAAAWWMLVTPAGRAWWRLPRFWGAAALGLVGLLPAWLAGRGNHEAALRFQFVERHDFEFHFTALRDLAVQAGLATPLLFVAFAWRWVVDGAVAIRGGAPLRGLAWGLSSGVLLGFLVLGCFADAERARFHWPLPAFLLALPLLVARPDGVDWEGRVRRGLAVATSVALLLVAATLALLVEGAVRDPREPPRFARPQPDNLYNWHAVADWTRTLPTTDGPLLADNFMLGAQLAFERPERAVYVLDHPLNAKHGRAAELASLGRDETALAASGWRSGTLVVEENSRRPLLRLAAWRALCHRFGSVRWLGELQLFGGEERYVGFAVTPPRGRSPAASVDAVAPVAEPCQLPAVADLSTPLPDARIDGPRLELVGWAIEEADGVDRVEVLLDGQVVADAVYGEPFPGVKNQWPDSTDPNQPRVGFRAMLDLAQRSLGDHRLALRVHGRSGQTSEVAERRITLTAGPERARR